MTIWLVVGVFYRYVR